jgi:hypothetical protein
MAESKTMPSAARVGSYIAARASPQQSADCTSLMALLHRLTGQSPVMWGPSIVGYGSYRYKYETGRTGVAPLLGFAIRGRELVVYLAPYWAEAHPLLERLGKHRMGKGCLYFKTLADLDHATLEQLLRGSIAETARRYGAEGDA